MYADLARLAVATAAISFAFFAPGCAAQAAHPDELESESHGTGDLPVGDVEDGLGAWGNATSCKPIPKVAPLKQPEITVSLDGLTLHLRDRAGDYDRVFPVGPGALEGGASKTPVGLFHTGSDVSEVKDGAFGYYYPCKIWWSDPDTGKQAPVFAGLPFIRLAGTPTAGYGIHGPIDSYTAPNGGSLRRGFVSHGCVRMAAADIVEVYARIRGVPRVPVRIQKEIERDSTGLSIDLPQRWIGAECATDADCSAIPSGTCKLASGAAHGICTAPCTHACPDKAGEGSTFCANDGFCAPQASPVFNATCARYEGALSLQKNVSRPDRTAHADVCH